jgi:hypothetical protein
MTAELLVTILGFYAASGLCFGVAFVAAILPRYDKAARGTPVGFRLLALPAASLLWPLVVWTWRRKLRGPHA